MDTLSPQDREQASEALQAAAADKSPGPGNKKSLHEDDLALARILQEQERAFHLLQMQQLQAASGQVDLEEEAFEEGPGEAEAAEDPNREMTDEEFARRLYEEERQQSLRALYAAQGVYLDRLGEEVAGADTEGLGYEDLTTLGEVAGCVSKGLRPDTIAALPVVSYGAAKAAGNILADMDKCCICQLEFEDEDEVTPLPACQHVYHQACVAQWLTINKVCPVCNKEIPQAPAP